MADAHLAYIEDMLEQGGVVAVGEVGLDFTSSCRHGNCLNKVLCREEKFQFQRSFLRRVLPLAERYDKVLVLHTRDRGDGTAAEEVRRIIVEMGLCHLRIHRHCFVGGVEELRRWGGNFSKCVFWVHERQFGRPLRLRDSGHAGRLQDSSGD